MGSEPDPKLFDSSNRLVVSGAFVEVDEHYDLNSHCNGEYVAEKDLRNEKFCYCRIGEDGKILPGCIFFYMNKWMICRTGKGSTSEGWNFSQTSDDSDSRYPPLGSWKKEKGSGNDHPRTIDYSSLQVEQQFPESLNLNNLGIEGMCHKASKKMIGPPPPPLDSFGKNRIPHSPEEPYLKDQKSYAFPDHQ